MNAIILCGGLSTRLGEITKNIPKILLQIGDKTVLDWQLDKLRDLGIREVVLAAGHLVEVLEDQIGEEREGVKLIYAIEDKRLGTGGAIKHGMEYIKNPGEPTIILNGDVLTTIDFKDMASYLRPESDGIILGSRVEDASSYGVLEYDNDYHLKAFKEKEGIEKVGYINGGVYIFNPQTKKCFPNKDVFSIEHEVFPCMKDLYIYESDRPWIDIGVPERLEWAKKHSEVFNN